MKTALFIPGLKKTIDGNKDSISALNQKISDKKRHQDELKEKCEKLQVELETTLKQKGTLVKRYTDCLIVYMYAIS